MHEEQRIIDAQKSQHSDASLTVVAETKNNLHFIDDERPKHRQLNDPINILNFSFLKGPRLQAMQRKRHTRQ